MNHQNNLENNSVLGQGSRKLRSLRYWILDQTRLDKSMQPNNYDINVIGGSFFYTIVEETILAIC